MTATSTAKPPTAGDDPKGLLDRIACLETATRVSVALAVAAFMGRILTFLIDGPTPMPYLIVLLAIATAAFVAATMSRKKARVGSLWNARLSAMSQRVGIIQFIVGIALVVLAVL